MSRWQSFPVIRVQVAKEIGVLSLDDLVAITESSVCHELCFVSMRFVVIYRA